MLIVKHERDINGKKVIVSMEEGEVLEGEESSRLHISGSGGGSNVTNGYGGGSDIQINSYTTTTTKAWVLVDGNESQWSIPCSFPIRPGHKLARFTIENNFEEKTELLLVWNKTSGDYWHPPLGVTCTRLKIINTYADSIWNMVRNISFVVLVFGLIFSEGKSSSLILPSLIAGCVFAITFVKQFICNLRHHKNAEKNLKEIIGILTSAR